MGKKHQTNLIKKEKRPLYTETNVLGNLKCKFRFTPIL